MKKRYHLHIGIIFVLAIVVLINYIVYEAMVLSLVLPNSHDAALFAGASMILGLSFFIVAFVAHTKNTFVTRSWYRISSIWLGFLIYLFCTSVFYILFSAIFFPSSSLALALFTITVGVTAVGAIHTRHTKIKKITIEIPGLPQAWKGRTAAFISDIHLGQVYGKGFAEAIVQKISALNADVVFVVGDLYDGVCVNEKDIVSPFGKLKNPLGTYFIMGNHEEFASNAKFLEGVRSVGMKVLLDEMTVVDGLQIIGVDYQTTNTPTKFKQVIDSIKFDPTQPNILLKHVPTDVKTVEEKGIQLMLSGHTHKGQTFPVTVLTRLMFGKYNYGYQTYKKLQVVTSSGVGTTGAPIRVETNSEIVLLSFK